MFQESIGILAALAFVLGLVWVGVWVAKRYGAFPSHQRARIAVEVVQRISIGPKSTLAVVRVGEKVMAVSMGPDGIRPLFELDESDRLRIIASSQTATPLVSSADAERRIGAHASFAAIVKNVLKVKGARTVYEAPVAQATQAADRDFRNVLNIAMSGATRLAVFAGFALLSAASANNLRAQAAPPVAPPTTQVAVPPAAGMPVVTPPEITVPPVPAFIVPKGAANAARAAVVRPANARTAPVRTPAAVPVGTQTGAAQTGAAQTGAAQNTAARAPQTPAAPGAQTSPPTIIPGSASRGANRLNAAPPAPVAGGDEALAKMLPQIDLKMGDGKDGGLRLSGTVGIVVMMGLLTLLPTLVLMMTGFTRILIVLHFLKQAMGTQSAPPAQLLAAMALLLTGFVMAPTLTQVNRTALEPWMDGRITQVEMLKEGVKPMRIFMLKQTREADLRTFIELSRLPRPNTVDDVPLHVLTSAFVASELRRAFQIGFMIYLPFIIIDAVVASVLMSMGMFMLPPAMISMPFKLLLFVLVDGWGLLIQELVKSFN